MKTKTGNRRIAKSDGKIWIKICGITRLCDALRVKEFGFDAIGFVFAKSPREIKAKAAREIIGRTGNSVAKVGVFVNEEISTVKFIDKYCELDYLQFHGDEGPDYIAKFGAKAIKAFSVDENFEIGAIKDYPQKAIFLLDAAFEGLRGGTGKTCDWQKASEAANSYEVILAGGLNAENAVEAVRKVKPSGIDISSGVEIAKGIKNSKKMIELKNAFNSYSNKG